MFLSSFTFTVKLLRAVEDFLFIFSTAFRSPFTSLFSFHFLKELYFFSHLPPMAFYVFTRTLPLRAVCFVFSFSSTVQSSSGMDLLCLKSQ